MELGLRVARVRVRVGVGVGVRVGVGGSMATSGREGRLSSTAP